LFFILHIVVSEKREERIEKRLGGFALQNKKREEAEETTISDWRLLFLFVLFTFHSLFFIFSQLSFPEKREERTEKRLGGFALQNIDEKWRCDIVGVR
jgi:hypothetical protein